MPIVFDHAVIYNGKYYATNTPIEETVCNAAEGAESANTELPDKEVAPETKAASKAAKGRRKATGDKA